MKKILVSSENFCFGSTSLLIAVLKELKKSSHIIFLGTGTALELARKEGYQYYIDIDTSSKKTFSLLKLFKPHIDLFISSMDLNSVQHAVKLQMKTAWLDSIFWYRDSIPKELAEVDGFFCQKSIADVEQKKAEAFKIKNFYLTGPIVPPFPQKKRENKLLVTFGGTNISSVFGFFDQTKYPEIITQLLLSSSISKEFNSIVVASNELVRAHLEKTFKNKDRSVKFVSLTHDEYMQELATAGCVVTSPGQQTVFESVFSKAPFITIPASNDTHYHVNQFLKTNGYDEYVISWNNFFSPMHFSYESAQAGIEELLENMQRFISSKKLQREFVHYLESCMNRLRSSKHNNALEKVQLVLGENGLEATREKIIDLLNSN